MIRPFKKEEIPFGSFARCITDRNTEYFLVEPHSREYIFSVVVRPGHIYKGRTILLGYLNHSLNNLKESWEYKKDGKWVPFGVEVREKRYFKHAFINTSWVYVLCDENNQCYTIKKDGIKPKEPCSYWTRNKDRFLEEGSWVEITEQEAQSLLEAAQDFIPKIGDRFKIKCLPSTYIRIDMDIEDVPRNHSYLSKHTPNKYCFVCINESSGKLFITYPYERFEKV